MPPTGPGRDVSARRGGLWRLLDAAAYRGGRQYFPSARHRPAVIRPPVWRARPDAASACCPGSPPVGLNRARFAFAPQRTGGNPCAAPASLEAKQSHRPSTQTLHAQSAHKLPRLPATMRVVSADKHGPRSYALRARNSLGSSRRTHQGRAPILRRSLAKQPRRGRATIQRDSHATRPRRNANAHHDV